MLVGYGPPDCLYDRIEGRPLFIIQLLNDDQPLFAFGVYGERRPAAGLERRMASLDRVLNVLRVMIVPAYYDQVFQPAPDEELSVLQKAEVARAQERAFSCIKKARGESVFGLLWAAPIPLRDAGRRHPYLSYLTLLALD